MPLFTLSNQFGGLMNRPEPHLVGPNRAVALSNVKLYSGGIMAQQGPGSPVYTGSAGTYLSCYKFNGTWVASGNTIAWQYVEFQGKLLRAASGHTPQISSDGSTWYNLGIKAPTTAATASDSGAGTGPTGTGYSYYVTGVSALGGESAPSPASNSVTGTGHAINLASVPTITETLADGASAQTVSRNVYRIGGSIAVASLVGNIPDNTTTTFMDTTVDANVGAAIQSTTYGVPPQLTWLAVAPYGVVYGGYGNYAYYCSPELPQAWPAANNILFSEATVGATAFGSSMFVLTGAMGYSIIGDVASGLAVRGIPAPYGCLARDTIVNMGENGIFYLANEGVCVHNGFNTQVASRLALSDATIGSPGAVSASGARAVRLGDRYILFIQSGTTFPSGGYLEWNRYVEGNWLMGTVTATAVHYNRTDDALYIAQGDNNVCQWEDPATGTPLAGFYTTGVWRVGQDGITRLKHWREGAVDHTSNVTVTMTLDGTTPVNAQALSQGNVVARSRFRFPAGSRGREVSGTLAWASGWTGKIVELLDNIERESTQL